MYQILYKLKQTRHIAVVCALGLFATSCAFLPGHYHGHDHGPGHTSADHAGGVHGGSGDGYGYGGGARAEVPESGLAIGAVVAAQGRSALKPYKHWRHADRLASHILNANPHMQGRIDSYEYVSKRMGAPFKELVKSYRLNGDLDAEALNAVRSAQLRRRYLMMVSILPNEETIELSPDKEAVIGRLNEDVDDYYDVRYQTIRLASVRVQVYDTVSGQKLSDDIFRSDDGGVSLAAERNSRKYVGNSIVATISNSATNGFRESEYPPAPANDTVYNYLWGRIARGVPGGVR